MNCIIKVALINELARCAQHMLSLDLICELCSGLRQTFSRPLYISTTTVAR
jgi:hypothetical protein